MSPVWVFVIKQRASYCKFILRNHTLHIAEQFKSVLDNGQHGATFFSLVELSTIKSQPFLFHNTIQLHDRIQVHDTKRFCRRRRHTRALRFGYRYICMHVRSTAGGVFRQPLNFERNTLTVNCEVCEITRMSQAAFSETNQIVNEMNCLYSVELSA